jgi:hypothetical protein
VNNTRGYCAHIHQTKKRTKVLYVRLFCSQRGQKKLKIPMNPEVCFDDVQRIFNNSRHAYNAWRTQELPLNEVAATEGWSRINVRPIDYTHDKLQYKCPRCSNSWTSDRHAYLLFKVNRQRHQIKIRAFGQQCLRCHSQTFVKPCYNEAQLRDAIDYVIEKISNGRIIIGSGSGRAGSTYTAAQIDQACEACHFDICQNPIND